MTGELALAGLSVQIHPGDGLIARYPSVLLVVLDDDATHRQVTEQLLQICADTRGAHLPPGRRVSRKIAGVLAAAEPEDVPSFCAVSDAGGGGLAAIVHGDADLHLSGEREEWLSGTATPTWVDRILSPGFDRLVVTRADSTPPESDDRLNLRAGIVPGGGVTVTTTAENHVPSVTEENQPTPAQEPMPLEQAPPSPLETQPAVPAGRMAARKPVVAPSVKPAYAEPRPERAGPLEPQPEFERVDSQERSRALVEPVTRPSEPEVVEGVLCPNGHFNDPAAAYCTMCGVSLAQKSEKSVLGPRPPLGAIVLDDGTTFPLSTDYVLGREPEVDESVRSGQAQPLVVTDEEATVSRVHADIRLQDWDVVLRDRGSANGTYIEPGNARQWIRLEPHVPVTLTPGSRVQIGQRSFVFELQHGS